MEAEAGWGRRLGEGQRLGGGGGWVRGGRICGVRDHYKVAASVTCRFAGAQVGAKGNQENRRSSECNTGTDYAGIEATGKRRSKV